MPVAASRTAPGDLDHLKRSGRGCPVKAEGPGIRRKLTTGQPLSGGYDSQAPHVSPEAPVTLGRQPMTALQRVASLLWSLTPPSTSNSSGVEWMGFCTIGFSFRRSAVDRESAIDFLEVSGSALGAFCCRLVVSLLPPECEATNDQRLSVPSPISLEDSHEASFLEGCLACGLHGAPFSHRSAFVIY